MKTLEEIRQQRIENAQAIKAKRDKRENARAKWEQLSEDDKKTYLLTTPTSQRIMRKWEVIDAEIFRLGKIALILKQNYRVALAARVFPVFVEILKKYNGKKAGEKTREKMRDEMMTACGCSVWFERSILSQKSEQANISEIVANSWSGEKIEIYTKNRACIIDEQNTINGTLTADDLLTHTGEHIDDPAARLDEIDRAAEAVETAKKAYNEAVKIYNALTVDGMKHFSNVY